MSRITTISEVVDAVVEYSKLFVSLDGRIDNDAMDSIAQSIGIVRNTVCVTLDSPALEKAIDVATGLGHSYALVYVDMSNDVRKAVHERVRTWPRFKPQYTAEDTASQGAGQYRTGFRQGRALGLGVN